MDSPLSVEEKRAMTHLVKCAMTKNATPVLELPTGGQV
jgi:hypothetical protein